MPPALRAAHRPRGSPRGAAWPGRGRRRGGCYMEIPRFFWLVFLRFWLFLRGFPCPAATGPRLNWETLLFLGTELMSGFLLDFLNDFRFALIVAMQTAACGGSAPPPLRRGPADFGGEGRVGAKTRESRRAAGLRTAGKRCPPGPAPPGHRDFAPVRRRGAQSRGLGGGRCPGLTAACVSPPGRSWP